MSRRKNGLIIAGQSGGINNNAATKNFDSREFTFKYIDRKLYNNGVASVPNTYSVRTDYPYPTLVIPHNLGYVPSYRFYMLYRDARNNYAKNNYQYELQQVNGSASSVNVSAYIGKNNFYITVKDSYWVVENSRIYFVFLIGADDLEADADETRYIA